MKKYYYGAWNSFYNLSWPVRFGVELIFFLIFLYIIIKLLRKIGNLLHLKIYLIKGCVWLVTEIVYLVGHNSEWAVTIDGKITDWGNKMLNSTGRKKHHVLKCFIALGIITVYLLAVLVDLPVSEYFQEYYLVELAHAKVFFQQWENAMSEGCEEYPPLFIKKESNEELIEETIVEEVKTIYIQLNEQGKNGSNIRRNPSLNAEIIGSVTGQTEIIYQNQWENDGERYWVKVYIPDDGIEGWLSGKLVDGEQLELILSNIN